MNFISVCSGIEAASVAWNPLGWKAKWFSEIEPFPCAVLAHHYPNTPNLGDMTKFKEWPDAAIDLLCGGTPCQSFSVAGLRKGLADPRGNLMLTFGAIAARYRPQWLVWENVPGVLSSNGGADFGAFLGMLGELGYGFAYRVLDAQYFGVAQRRRRVFVVGCLGDWRSAAAVLFERHSMQGHPAPRREAGQRVANALTDRADRGGTNSEGQRLIPELAACITTGTGRRYDTDTDTDTILPVAHSLRGRPESAAVGHVLPVSFNPQSGGKQTALGYQPGTETVGTLVKNQTPAVAEATQVRRLTPRECERLQGFPDDYTAVMHRKKPAADGPRYKALGNSWAVPNVRWIGERLEHVDAIRRQQRAAA